MCPERLQHGNNIYWYAFSATHCCIHRDWSVRVVPSTQQATIGVVLVNTHLYLKNSSKFVHTISKVKSLCF